MNLTIALSRFPAMGLQAAADQVRVPVPALQRKDIGVNVKEAGAVGFAGGLRYLARFAVQPHQRVAIAGLVGCDQPPIQITSIRQMPGHAQLSSAN